MKKVLITGATGFIGSHILGCFSDRGVQVLCLARATSRFDDAQSRNCEVRPGDIRDLDSLNRALQDVDFVIHNAALAKDWGSYETFYETNVQGTLNILQACVNNRIRNVIVTGSISSYGEEDNRLVKDETHGFNSHYRYFLDSVFPNGNNHYRDTKALATQKAMAFAREHGLNLTVLEPVWVYGEREFDTGFFQYVRSVKDGMFAVPGSKTNKFHVIYAGDLARAYYLAFQKRLPGVHRIIVGNRRAELMTTVFSRFCAAAGVKKPAYLPKWSVYPTGFCLELFYTMFGAKKAPALSRSRVNMFYDNIEYCTDKAEALLGFRSEYSLSAGIERTVSWYKERKYL